MNSSIDFNNWALNENVAVNHFTHIDTPEKFHFIHVRYELSRWRLYRINVESEILLEEQLNKQADSLLLLLLNINFLRIEIRFVFFSAKTSGVLVKMSKKTIYRM